MSFEINLPLFHGPFDLMLFFIERDELDIKDIPIAKITDEFLEYIHHLESLNVEVAGEFMLVAATLMQIKAKMLLPRPELDEQGREIDPRDELIKHLMEYKKYKSVMSDFVSMEERRLQMEKRGNTGEELKTMTQNAQSESEMLDLDMYKLLKVYVRVMQKYMLEQDKPVHKVIPYHYTIEAQKDYISNLVKQNKKISFEEIIMNMPDKIAVIFNFLAILEMIQSQMIHIQIGEGYNNFWIFDKQPQMSLI
ncbi:MAG: segregation/condensation protein A [Cytophagales bacterium]|nr:segregation/condensation protein A [Cytophagales bacterium]